MLGKLTVCAIWLLASIFVCLFTYETIKTGRAPIGRAGTLYVERDKSPLAYQVRVVISCLVLLVFVGVALSCLYDLIR